MMRLRKARIICTAALSCSLTTAFCVTQQPIKAPLDRGAALRSFLANKFKENGRPGPPAQYARAFVDLNGDGVEEALVYVTGGGWCGSGGCSLLILEPQGNTYRAITETSVTQLPIRMLTTKTNGWHDIGVIVAGGGIIPGDEAKLSFNGRKYPSNPTVAPARPLKRTVPGRVLISRDAPQTPLNQ